MKLIAGDQPPRPKDDKDGASIEQHGAGRGGPNETAIDQYKFEREERAGYYSRQQRAVGVEQWNPRSWVHAPTRTAAMTERAAAG